MMTSYKFKSLEAIADHLERLSNEKMGEVEGLAEGARLRQRGLGAADALADTATMLRATTIDPSME